MAKIQKRLEEDSLTVSKKSVCLLIKKYKLTRSIANDKLFAPKVQRLLQEQFPDLVVSKSTMKRA